MDNYNFKDSFLGGYNKKEVEEYVTRVRMEIEGERDNFRKIGEENEKLIEQQKEIEAHYRDLWQQYEDVMAENEKLSLKVQLHDKETENLQIQIKKLNDANNFLRKQLVKGQSANPQVETKASEQSKADVSGGEWTDRRESAAFPQSFGDAALASDMGLSGKDYRDSSDDVPGSSYVREPGVRRERDFPDDVKEPAFGDFIEGIASAANNVELSGQKRTAPGAGEGEQKAVVTEMPFANMASEAIFDTSGIDMPFSNMSDQPDGPGIERPFASMDSGSLFGDQQDDAPFGKPAVTVGSQPDLGQPYQGGQFDPNLAKPAQTADTEIQAGGGASAFPQVDAAADNRDSGAAFAQEDRDATPYPFKQPVRDTFSYDDAFARSSRDLNLASGSSPRINQGAVLDTDPLLQADPGFARQADSFDNQSASKAAVQPANSGVMDVNAFGSETKTADNQFGQAEHFGMPISFDQSGFASDDVFSSHPASESRDFVQSPDLGRAEPQFNRTDIQPPFSQQSQDNSSDTRNMAVQNNASADLAQSSAKPKSAGSKYLSQLREIAKKSNKQ